MLFALRFLGLLVLVALLSPVANPARADENRTHIEDAHHQLALALNLGGPAPADADRIAALKTAEADLKKMTFPLRRYSHARSMANTHIKNALELIAQGEADHRAEQEIRDADSIVRDIEQ